MDIDKIQNNSGFFHSRYRGREKEYFDKVDKRRKLNLFNNKTDNRCKISDSATVATCCVNSFILYEWNACYLDIFNSVSYLQKLSLPRN